MLWVDRALKTVLETDELIMIEAKDMPTSTKILEEAEEEMSVGKRHRHLELLVNICRSSMGASRIWVKL